MEARRAQTLTFLDLIPFSTSVSCNAFRMVASRVASAEPSSPSGLMAKFLRDNPARVVRLELHRQLEAATRPEIHRQKCLCIQHF